MAAVELVAKGGHGLTGPAFDGQGRLFVCGADGKTLWDLNR